MCIVVVLSAALAVLVVVVAAAVAVAVASMRKYMHCVCALRGVHLIVRFTFKSYKWLRLIILCVCSRNHLPLH
jgi:hypothetical protein